MPSVAVRSRVALSCVATKLRPSPNAYGSSSTTERPLALPPDPRKREHARELNALSPNGAPRPKLGMKMMIAAGFRLDRKN
jgi:hypothetical protein